jgi:hypothetical protein
VFDFIMFAIDQPIKADGIIWYSCKPNLELFAIAAKDLQVSFCVMVANLTLSA